MAFGSFAVICFGRGGSDDGRWKRADGRCIIKLVLSKIIEYGKG